MDETTANYLALAAHRREHGTSAEYHEVRLALLAWGAAEWAVLRAAFHQELSLDEWAACMHAEGWRPADGVAKAVTLLNLTQGPDPMNEYRCTRPDLYQGNCTGATSAAERQGHYRDASTSLEAAKQMAEDYSNETFFDVQLWPVVGKSGEVERFVITKDGPQSIGKPAGVAAAR